MVNQTTESLVVECLPGFDGGLDQLFHMEVTDLQTGQLITNTSGEPAPEFEVSGLNSGRGMKITIFAANADGRSDSAVLEGFTLKVAELQLGKLQLQDYVVIQERTLIRSTVLSKQNSNGHISG